MAAETAVETTRPNNRKIRDGVVISNKMSSAGASRETSALALV